MKVIVALVIILTAAWAYVGTLEWSKLVESGFSSRTALFWVVVAILVIVWMIGHLIADLAKRRANKN